MKNPKFCIITPISQLEQYASQSDTHLVLAHLVDSNKEYAEFYKKMSKRGDQLILDNSAFELKEPYKPEKLIELATIVGAQTIVLPDYPFQSGITTVDAANEFIPLFKEAGFKCMFVPQSKVDDLEDWMYAYSWAAINPHIDAIGMSILGIPNALPHIPKSYARVVMSQLLISKGIFNHNKYHHYLGLNSGPNVELPALIKMNALNSCDSSNPVWCGINNIEYNEYYSDWMGFTKDRLPHVDFDYSDNVYHNTIQHNLDLTLSIFK